MTTLLIQHSASHAHATPPGHPERIERIEALDAMLEQDFEDLPRLEAPLGEDGHLRLAHPDSFIESIRAASPATNLAAIDADTWMSPGTLEAALRAVGGACMAVDKVMAGEAPNAFCVMRPPGHHAEKTTAMGFCFFSTAAIAALHAIEEHGLSRTAVLDFDVHHGNGTQDVVWDDPRVFYGSSHEWGIFPGKGAAHETGAGNIVNAPLDHHADSADFRAAWDQRILPALEAFGPEFIVISAGFDAHADDPLASINLNEDDFDWITERLCAIAAKHCGGRVVSVLEGGYDLGGLARSAAAHVRALVAAAGEGSEA